MRIHHLAWISLLVLAACNDGWLVGSPPDGSPSPTETPTGDHGAVEGRICAPSGEHWLAGARVFLPVPLVETVTAGDGTFTLQGLPVGDHELHVVKGSFQTTFPVHVQAGVTAALDEPVCVSDVHVAVITGYNDNVLPLLGALGLSDITVYDDPGSLLLDGPLLSTYDIVFINCGAIDFLAYVKDATMIANMRAHVSAGGSIYASDWAYAFLEVAFPEAIDFVGDDDSYLAATVGPAGSVGADVVDTTLAAYLGGSDLTVTFDIHDWAVMSATGANTRELVVDGATPLVVVHTFGQGRLLHTSFHTSAQATEGMTRALEFMVFEL